MHVAPQRYFADSLAVPDNAMAWDEHRHRVFAHRCANRAPCRFPQGFDSRKAFLARSLIK
jgi:hypothetical protein